MPDRLKVVVVSPEPTPYRAPLFDRIGARDDVDLFVVYAAPTIGSREWTVELGHRARVLDGLIVPARRLLLHDYPITPQIWGLLSRERPDVVVVAGWALFASQAAILWCRLHHVPYVLTSESHGLDPRPRWIEALKRGALPPIVRGAAASLVTGRRAAEFLERNGARPDSIHVFANSPDSAALAERARERGAKREEIRAGYGFSNDDVVVVSVARLLAQKGIDVLVRAVARVGRPLRLLLVGSGPERSSLATLALEEGVDPVFVGHLEGDALVDAYVAADIFALLSRREPWGVVVNEALACGLPVIVSDRVGAAYDLVDVEHNGLVVPVDAVGPTARALGRLADDAALRHRFGEHSRALAASWGHAASVEEFMAAVTAAAR